jgi:glyoxylase-like metal-dependent hydrolase (beta-lactamase superfamily II)
LRVNRVQSPPELKLGSFRIAFLTDGLWYNDGGCMFGVVPRALWQRQHPPDEQNRVRLNLTCPLVIRGRDAILIDCGIGNRLSDVERKIFAHGEGWLPDGLAALGMEAGDITHVILSHLHFDHCGGVVRRQRSGELMRAFPRARHFIQRGEYEVSANTANERLRAAYRHTVECLAPLQGSIELLDGDTTIVPGVEARVTGGHTRDHQIAMVRDAGQALLHLADLVPTRSHMRGPWNQAYDLDALTTMERKAHYLEQAWRERWWVSFAHDDQLFGAQVERASGVWEVIERVAVGKRD